MESITRKPIIKGHVENSLRHYEHGKIDDCVSQFHERILSCKVKFPLLEYGAAIVFESLSEDDHIPFCDQIEALKTEGGNVIIGIIIQKRLPDHFQQSIDKAAEYVSIAHIWYICDIIGERTFGFSLLHEPKKTIPEIKKLSNHNKNWVRRSLGAGVHYAVKKGLEKEHVKTVFEILLSMANSKDKEVRQGIGWAAKTTAKFHPDIIDLYRDDIDNELQVASWFRTKVRIGLSRYEYAKRNRG